MKHSLYQHMHQLCQQYFSSTCFFFFLISVLMLHLPSSQLFVAADLQNKCNTEQIEVHTNGHPAPPNPPLHLTVWFLEKQKLQ